MLAHCSGQLIQSKPFYSAFYFLLVVCLLEEDNLKASPVARRSLKFIVITLTVQMVV